MSAVTGIEWTATVHPDGSVTPGKTWNPVRGCSVISPGCHSCYAMKMAHRFNGDGQPYEGLTKQTSRGPQWTGVVRTIESALLEPLSWRKPSKVFVNSMSDLFHEDVPDAFIDKVFAVMALAPQHTFQILTKRPERMRDYMVGLSKSAKRIEAACPVGYALRWEGISLVPFPFPNVWLGTSVENQHFLSRIDILKDVPAAVRFVSFEPLLEDLGAVILDRIHWCIVGGESGPHSRPFDLAWARSIVRQCKAAGVACFVKQVGAVPTMQCSQCGRSVGQVLGGFVDACGPTHAALIGESQRIRDRKGGDPAEWPEDLRVREFPEARA